MARFVRNVDRNFGKSVFTRGHLASGLGVSQEVGDQMLKVQAEILAEQQRKNAGTMLNAEGFGKGYTRDSIQVSNPYTRGNVRFIQIRFWGKRPDGKRAAEVAFLNEFGIGDGERGCRMRARGFIAKANAEKMDEAERAAADILEEWTANMMFDGLDL